MEKEEEKEKEKKKEKEMTGVTIETIPYINPSDTICAG